MTYLHFILSEYDLIKIALSEKIVQRGFTDVFIGMLVRIGLILLVLLTCWIIHQIEQGPRIAIKKFRKGYLRILQSTKYYGLQNLLNKIRRDLHLIWSKYDSIFK